MLRSMDEVWKNGRICPPSSADGVYLQYLAFYVNLMLLFSLQWINVCKIYASKVAYHEPFNP